MVRHGEARSEHVDPERALAENGRRDVSLVAEHLSSLGLKVSKIYHSEKLRAKQTAEILSHNLRPRDGLEEVKGLAPSDNISTALRIIENAEEPIMIVGHLPHLSKLLSELVVRGLEEELLSFDAGGVVCIAREGDHGIIKWSLSARTLKPGE